MAVGLCTCLRRLMMIDELDAGLIELLAAEPRAGI